jgi:multiple sugar transport system permease protein
MSVQGEGSVAIPRAGAVPRRSWLGDLFEREGSLGYLLMAPALLLLLIFMAYPFVLGIAYSLRSDRIGTPGVFVGLDNFIRLITQDGIFQQTVRNTFAYTLFATIGKVVLGLALALLMHQTFPGRNLVRAGLLLPYIIPTALSTLAWKWIFHNVYGIINLSLKGLGLITTNIVFLGLAKVISLPPLADISLALASLIGVNIWRGTPFFAIGLLAGLQTIPQELYEAAEIDGAGAWRRFWHVTLPLITPVLTIIVLFSVIQTFADFQLIWVLTGGGPTNATHVFATYAYQIGMLSGELSNGAAISLFMFPFMLIFTVLVLWYQRRDLT